MAGLNETPSANRVRIAFFGLRNAGKSTLVNAFTGQPIAIVSDVAGTTTDPVSKAMEILPLGPCVVTDTAGLDDEGELGLKRVEKTLKVLETTDIAVWVWGADEAAERRGRRFPDFADACRRRNVAVIEHRRGDSVEELKRKVAAVRLGDDTPGLLDGLVTRGDRVLCVCPIDESAPKGRLILPQVQVIRACLDLGATATVCQPGDVERVLGAWCLVPGAGGLVPGAGGLVPGAQGSILVVTDSQAFGEVSKVVERVSRREDASATEMRLTSFSILFARQKGDVAAYLDGLKALKNLKDGDRVLIAEGCTHHRQCNDIGTVKIPKAIAKLTGRKLEFSFVSGMAFESANSPIDQSTNRPIEQSTNRPIEQSTNRPIEQSTNRPIDQSNNSPNFPIEQSNNRTIEQFSLIVQCGGCMLTRREVMRRIGLAREAGVPIVNYGMVLALAAGVDLETCVF